MKNYIKIMIDGGYEAAISWEDDMEEEGVKFDDFMEKIEVAIVAAGYSQACYDRYMKGELK